MMNRDKVVNALLAVAIVLPLGACASELTKEEAAKTETKTATKTVEWSYEGDTGPAKWSTLDTEYAACANGTEQSPIDIELSEVKMNKQVGHADINYQPTTFTLKNNGHTIQANDASGSNTITIDGQVYKLLQFHFHRPSENQINGKSFDMELHLVHKNEEGKLAVLGVLIKTGSENKQLAEIFSKLPKEKTEEDIKLDQVIDLNALLPKDKKAFHYEGSLTTPPCSEGVKWTVFEEPIELSAEQIQAFAAIFPDDHRPVQSLNGRAISTEG